MRKRHFTRYRGLYKWLLIIVAIFAIVIVGLIGYFAKEVSPLVSQKLNDQVVRSSDSLYHIVYNELSINPITGNITLTGFKLIPNMTVYNHLKSLNRAPENIFRVSVPKLQLEHAHPFKLLIHRKVRINDVRFETPKVEILHEDLFPSDTAQSVEKMLANLISGPLRAIRIDRMDLSNVGISYKNSTDSAGRGFLLQNADFILKDFYIDTTSIKDTTRLFYAKDLQLHLMNLKLPTADSLYMFNLKDFVYSMDRQRILVKELSLKPRYKEADFDRKIGYQQDRFDLKIDSISVFGFDILTVLRKKMLGAIEKIEMNHGYIDIYHNRSLPPKKGIKLFPQQMLIKAATKVITKNIAIIFAIDTTSIQNINITYRELNPKSGRIGSVTFQQIKGNLNHITNDSNMLAKNNHCTADLSTLFMGSEKAQVHFDFNLTDPDKSFSYVGSLGYMKATRLNKATRNLGLVAIQSGNIHRVHFNFSGNLYRSVGSVNLLYDDLSVRLLKRDETSGKLNKKGLASLFANLMVLHKNNTTDTAILREARITYQRDPKKSILNMMWKSLFEGIKKIVGMD